MATRRGGPGAYCAGVSAGPDRTAVVHGTTVVLERRARVLDDGAVLLGGAPPRMLHLSPTAAARLVGGRLTVTDATSAALARRLLDAGIAHPVAEPPAAVPPPSDVTVVVPVKDRTDGLARLLAALEIDVSGVCRGPNPAHLDLGGTGSRGLRVIVVDDGSADPAAVRAVAGARGGRRAAPPHPARPGRRAQRRAGRRHHPAGRVPRLRRRAGARLAAAAAGAPRGPGGRAGRAAHRRAAAGHGLAGPLRGRAFVARPRPGPRPGRPALPRRLRPERSAASSAAPPSDRGSTRACTSPRTSTSSCACTPRAGGCATSPPPASRTTTAPRLRAWWLRKAFYGTGAAPLALRHRGAVPPMVLSPWAALTSALLLAQAAGRGRGGVGGRRVPPVHQARPPAPPARDRGPADRARRGRRRRADRRRRHPALLAARRAGRGRIPPRPPHGRGRRARQRRRSTGGAAGPERPALPAFLVARRLDDLAYGAGLWWGAVAHRTLAPLRPAAACGARHRSRASPKG